MVSCTPCLSIPLRRRLGGQYNTEADYVALTAAPILSMETGCFFLGATILSRHLSGDQPPPSLQRSTGWEPIAWSRPPLSFDHGFARMFLHSALRIGRERRNCDWGRRLLGRKVRSDCSADCRDWSASLPLFVILVGALGRAFGCCSSLWRSFSGWGSLLLLCGESIHRKSATWVYRSGARLRKGSAPSFSAILPMR